MEGRDLIDEVWPSETVGLGHWSFAICDWQFFVSLAFSHSGKEVVCSSLISLFSLAAGGWLGED